MDSKKRVFDVFEKRIPDRVPLFEFWFDSSVLQKIDPGLHYFDFCVREGLDIIVVDIDHKTEVIDAEKQLTRNEWGVTRLKTIERTTVPVDGPIRCAKDLARYRPPDPTDRSCLATLRETVRRFGDQKCICMHVHDAFNIPWYLRGGIENLLIDYIDNPRLALDLAKVTIEYYREIVREAAASGADLFIIGDDYAYKTAPLMSPSQFERFIAPGLAEIVSEIKKHGAYSIKHSDGNLGPVLDMIVDCGIDALHPIEGEAGMDILRIKEKYQERIVVCGNVDCGHLLSEAPVQEVTEQVKELIRTVSPGGRHILSSSNSIHHSVLPQNYMAMIETAKTFGKYPIDLERKENGSGPV